MSPIQSVRSVAIINETPEKLQAFFISKDMVVYQALM
jgi:hypothetical protein